MFSKIVSVLFFAYFAILAAATGTPTTITATPTPTATTISQCNTGNAQCCNSVQRADSLGLAAILGLLNIVIQPISVLVGVTCSPITVVGGGGGANCAQQPVCCSNNNFNGIINIGCTPISL